MKLRRAVVGIILAFSATGVVVANENANAYQEVYTQQDKQERQIQTILNSEFISEEDSELLKQKVTEINQAEEKANRQTLKTLIAEEQQDFSAVKKRVAKNEKLVIQTEQEDLLKKITELETKSKEKFIAKKDRQQLTELKEEAQLASNSTITIIRELTRTVSELAEQMENNQALITETVKELAELNKSSEALAKQKYLSSSEKEELVADRKENATYLEQTDDLQAITERKSTSQSLVTRLQTKQTESAEDFDAHEKKATEFIQTARSLVANGDLTSDEQAKLEDVITTLDNSLKMKNYQPGDLAKNSQTLQTTYDESLEKSNERIAEAKKKAEKEAAERAKKEAEEQAAREKEAQAEAARQQAAVEQMTVEQATNANDSATPTLVGDWHQAPAGYKYLKVESGKTYGQVKNPNNFSLITEAEAANYSPGHGNGSAKQ